jgi:hypothetical protein
MGTRPFAEYNSCKHKEREGTKRIHRSDELHARISLFEPQQCGSLRVTHPKQFTNKMLVILPPKFDHNSRPEKDVS